MKKRDINKLKFVPVTIDGNKCILSYANLNYINIPKGIFIYEMERSKYLKIPSGFITGGFLAKDRLYGIVLSYNDILNGLPFKNNCDIKINRQIRLSLAQYLSLFN